MLRYAISSWKLDHFCVSPIFKNQFEFYCTVYTTGPEAQQTETTAGLLQAPSNAL